MSKEITLMSPYKASKLVSKAIGREVPPQKLYGDIRKGKLQASRNSTDKLQVSEEAIESYIAKLVAKDSESETEVPSK